MSLSIYSWNVNGIRSVHKKGALKRFITELSPDIICFQETRAGAEQFSQNTFKDYEKFWNAGSRPGYSGTAIWTKRAPLNVYYGLPEALIADYKLAADAYGDPSNEGRTITLEFDEFFLVTVYTPNSKGDLGRLELRDKRWDPAFLAYVTQRMTTKPVIFCGDLNVAHTEIDLANPKANRGKHGFTDEERQGFDNMLEAGFKDTFRMFNQEPHNYTWWTHWAKARERNVGWRIDYVMASESIADRVKDAKIHADVMGSDHCPVSIELELPSAVTASE